jgi:hypothetical protein
LVEVVQEREYFFGRSCDLDGSFDAHGVWPGGCEQEDRRQQDVDGDQNPHQHESFLATAFVLSCKEFQVDGIGHGFVAGVIGVTS